MMKLFDRILRGNRNQLVAGLHVVRSAKHTIVLERVSPSGSRQLELIDKAGAALLKLELDGKASYVSYSKDYKHDGLADPEEVRLASRPNPPIWREVLGSEIAAQQLYADMSREIAGTAGAMAGGGIGPKLRGAGWMVVGALAVVVLAFTFSGGSPNAQASARIPGLPAGVAIGPQGVIAPGTAAEAQSASAGARGVDSPRLVPGEAMLTSDERKQLGDLKGVIALRAKGKEFYVFSDPNCPHCRDFEQTLAQLSGDYKPVIVPVAFQVGSQAKVEAVLCASDPAAEWKRVMAGGAPSSKACAKGQELLAENELRFRSFRLSATPTIVSPAKSLLVSSAASPQELALVLKN